MKTSCKEDKIIINTVFIYLTNYTTKASISDYTWNIDATKLFNTFTEFSVNINAINYYSLNTLNNIGSGIINKLRIPEHFSFLSLHNWMVRLHLQQIPLVTI